MPEGIPAVLERYLDYGYPVLFAGVLLENAGIPVPGETVLLAAGFLSSPVGGGHFNVLAVIAVATVAAVIGDNLGYWLGRELARPRLRAGRRFLFLTPRGLQVAEGYFASYGVWTVFFARFVTGLRVVGALAAGTAGMPWGRFLAANAAGALSWATAMALVGYFFGHSWHLLHEWLTRGGLIALVCVAVVGGLIYLMRRLRHTPYGLPNLARAQVLTGLIVAALEVACIAALLTLERRPEPDAIDEAIARRLAVLPEGLAAVLAFVGAWAGSLPITALAAVLTVGWLWRRGRPWRERAAVGWSLVAGEGAGLALVGLLHLVGEEPMKAAHWPFGFAGLVPLRAVAVLGMIAYVLGRKGRRARWAAWSGSTLLALLAGFAVVWAGRQTPSEVMLEYAAGALVLFAGIWWAEGFGPGLIGPSPSEPPRPEIPPPAT